MFIYFPLEQTTCSASSLVLAKRGFDGVKNWDTCMDNKVCKIVAIVVIVVASLLILWVVSSISRCLCCGVTCLNSFCCCMGRRNSQQAQGFGPAGSYNSNLKPDDSNSYYSLQPQTRYDPPAGYSIFTRKLGGPHVGSEPDQLAPAPLPSQVFQKPPPSSNPLYNIADRQFGEDSAFNAEKLVNPNSAGANRPIQATNRGPFEDTAYQGYKPNLVQNQPTNNIQMNDLSNSNGFTTIPQNVMAADADAYNRIQENNTAGSGNAPAPGIIRGDTNIIHDSDSTDDGYFSPNATGRPNNFNSYNSNNEYVWTPTAGYSVIQGDYTGTSATSPVRSDPLSLPQQQQPFSQQSNNTSVHAGSGYTGQSYNEIANINPTSLINKDNQNGSPNAYGNSRGANIGGENGGQAAPYPTSSSLTPGIYGDLGVPSASHSNAPYPTDSSSIFDDTPKRNYY